MISTKVFLGARLTAHIANPPTAEIAARKKNSSVQIDPA
jgi:hypothetical protein